MALDINPAIATYDAPEKDLYEMGEMPPMGYVPKQMHAWVLRRERHGEPDKALQLEVVDVPEIDSHDVLVLVMAAGVNYNGVWACLGQPVSVFDGTRRLTPSSGRTRPASSGRWATR
jgi:crotonyl-CoA carboxylase/reductase